MPKLPSLTPRKLIAFLEGQGFVVDHTSGSHVVMYNSDNKKRAVVPFHNKDIPRGTLFAILRESGFSQDDYLRLSKS